MVNYKKKYLKYKLKYQNLLGGANGNIQDEEGMKKVMAFMIAQNSNVTQFEQPEDFNSGKKLTNYEYLMKLIRDQLPNEFYKISKFFDLDAINNSSEINDNRYKLKQLAIDFHLLYEWFEKTQQPISLEFLQEISHYPNLNFKSLIALLNYDNLPIFIVKSEEYVYPHLYEAMEEAYGYTAALEEELEELQESQKINLIAFSEEKRPELNQKYGL